MNKAQKEIVNKKEFDRSVCFMFFESYLESAEKFQKQLGTEIAFNYLVGIARYALYQEESEDELINALVSGLKNTIDSGQEKRSRGFNKEDFSQTKLVAEYHRDHPEASQRQIVDALGGVVSKTKVQKTLSKIKESGLSIDEYITNVINPNLNNNSNNNTNSNNNRETATETSRGSSLSELANAQTDGTKVPKFSYDGNQLEEFDFKSKRKSLSNNSIKHVIDIKFDEVNVDGHSPESIINYMVKELTGASYQCDKDAVIDYVSRKFSA